MGSTQKNLETTKKPVFRQGNRISQTPVYPMHLHELEIISNIGFNLIK